MQLHFGQWRYHVLIGPPMKNDTSLFRRATPERYFDFSELPFSSKHFFAHLSILNLTSGWSGGSSCVTFCVLFFRRWSLKQLQTTHRDKPYFERSAVCHGKHPFIERAETPGSDFPLVVHDRTPSGTRQRDDCLVTGVQLSYRPPQEK